MIPVQRLAAPPAARTLLDRRTAKVRAAGGTAKTAREEWEQAAAAKRHVRALLEQMAHGVRRCMYCEDSLGTDIDHFQPLAAAPLRAFDWLNHLLACSHCNSNHKRDEYPTDAAGAALLVDPSAEDPAAHLTLLLASGAYEPRTRKGAETIRVFALNRGDLLQGRRAAFITSCAVLRDWHRHHRQGQATEAGRIAQALRDVPFADVLHAMTHLSPALAPTLLGDETATAVATWHRIHGV